MKKRRTRTLDIILFIIIAMILATIISIPYNISMDEVKLSYDDFYTQLDKDNIKSLEVRIDVGTYTATGEFKKPITVTEEMKKDQRFISDTATFFTAVLPEDTSVINKINTKIEENNLTVDVFPYERPITLSGLLMFLLSFGSIGIFVWFMFRMSKQQGKAMNFGQNKSKKIVNSNIKFDDVAGYEEEKMELIEIVDFLKNPYIYKKMGARVPKGVLLVGPPGTGKTLIAKAVAGEAGVNFITQSGSEFVEMFVGVGASRARQLFAEAKKNAPCIIFIDEIDAIGRRRGNGLGGGNDEKEQTLNQILIEMDGFLENSGIVVVGATNRSDVLDPALLRPGRFDRQVQVNLPNLKEREAILKLHAKKRELAGTVDLKEVAKNTAGFSGAQLENVINESAIVAVRNQKKKIDKNDVSEAIDRVIMGPAKKTRKYTKQDKELVAYHETGHVIVGLELEDADVIQKVTIIPRGNAGGYSSFSPKEDRFNYSKSNLEEKITGLLGGRAAEEVILGEKTAGAHNDFERATKIARSMVEEYGMSSLGIYQYQHREDDQPGYLIKRYSDEIGYKIDQEIIKILNECYERAKEIVKTREKDVKLIANALIEVETLERIDIDYLLENGKLPEVLESERYTNEEIEELQEKGKKEAQEVVEKDNEGKIISDEIKEEVKDEDVKTKDEK